MRTYVVVDVEANGPIPGDFSMTSLGATIADDALDKTFKINIKPISPKSDPGRKQFIDSKDAVDAKEAMIRFNEWLKQNTQGKIVFISDNNGFDWMFVCWYFWHFLNENPFGFNSYNMTSIYKGTKMDLSANLEELRERRLTHDSGEDSKDNAEIYLKIIARMRKDEQER